MNDHIRNAIGRDQRSGLTADELELKYGDLVYELTQERRTNVFRGNSGSSANTAIPANNFDNRFARLVTAVSPGTDCIGSTYVIGANLLILNDEKIVHLPPLPPLNTVASVFAGDGGNTPLDLQDNGVGLTKLETGAPGSVVGYDASGNPGELSDLPAGFIQVAADAGSGLPAGDLQTTIQNFQTTLNSAAPVMTGATATIPGTQGAVTAPAAGDEDKFFKGDGTWAFVSSTFADLDDTGALGVAGQPARMNAAADTVEFGSVDATYIQVMADAPANLPAGNLQTVLSTVSTSVATNTAKAAYPAADAAKLAAIELGATADQTSTEIVALIDTELGNTDWKTQRTIEEIQDVVGALFQAGTHTDMTVVYNDATNSIDLTATSIGGGLTQEETEDVVGALVSVAGGGINVTYDDLAGTLTFSLSGISFTATDQSAIVANTAKNSYPTADAAKLTGIAAGAEVNVQADWTEANITSDAYIANKPTLVTSFSDLSDGTALGTAGQPARMNAAGNAIEFGIIEAAFTTVLADVASGLAAGDLQTSLQTLSTHSNDTTNPHGVTATQVGLGNANNTSDADKPVSTAQQTALDGKVDTVAGKGLSTEDYTTAEQTKLAGIVPTDIRTLEEFQDAVAAMLQAGTHTNVTVTYNDATGTIDLASTGSGGLDQEQVEDIVGALNVAGSGITATYDDAGGTLTIALSGESYTTAEQTKLAGIAAGAEVNVQADWNEATNTADSFIVNKPTTITAAESAAIVANTAKNDYPIADSAKLAGIAAGAEVNVQADWNEANNTVDSFIANKPTTITAAESAAIVANTAKNDYPTADSTKLAGIAAGAEVNIQADWNEATNTADSFIANKPTLVTAFAGLSDGGALGTAGQPARMNAAADTIEFGTVAATFTTVDADVPSGLTAGDLQTVLQTFSTDLGNKVDTVAGKGLSTEDYTTAEQTKLAGIVPGDIRTLEELQDAVAAMLQGGTHTNLTVTYNDAGGTIDLAASGGGGGLNQEQVEDIVDSLVSVAGGGINVVYDDTAGTLTFSLSGESYTTAEQTKLAGIATGAEVNVQADWNEATNTADSFILNKPTTITAAESAAIVANTAKNDYPTADSTKLAGIAAGAEVNVQADWNEATNTADSFIANKPTLVTAFAGLSDGGALGTAGQPARMNAAADTIEFGTVAATFVTVDAHAGSGLAAGDVQGTLQLLTSASAVMTGADGTTAGTQGTVPAPAATDNNKLFKGDGTWASEHLTDPPAQVEGAHAAAVTFALKDGRRLELPAATGNVTVTIDDTDRTAGTEDEVSGFLIAFVQDGTGGRTLDIAGITFLASTDVDATGSVDVETTAGKTTLVSVSRVTSTAWMASVIKEV